MTVLNGQILSGLRWMKKSVEEALEYEGEIGLFYQMYNDQNSDGVNRCPYCFNGAYAQMDYSGSNQWCPYCFGTTYEGGIKEAYLTAFLLSKPDISDGHKNYGDLAEQTCNLYLPSNIKAYKGDFAIRINGFDLISENPITAKPKSVEAWQIQVPKISVVKDGLSQFGSFQRIGTSARCSLVNTAHPITNVAIKNVSPLLFAPSPPQGALLNVSFYSLNSNNDTEEGAA